MDNQVVEEHDRASTAPPPPPPSRPPPAAAPHRRRWLAWTVLAIVLALVAWWLIALWRKPPPPKPPAPTPVTAAFAQSGDVPIYLDGIGTVQAYNAVTVRAQVDGTLNQINFVEGQDVKAGDVLAHIDARQLRAQLDQALATRARDAAQLANARVDLQRYTTLVAQDSIATQQLDTQRALADQYAAAVQNDDAVIAAARVQLGYTTIVSPISGRTGVRLVDAGNVVHAADTTGIVTVTQIEPVSVLFTLPEDVVGPVLARARRAIDGVGDLARRAHGERAGQAAARQQPDR